MNPALENDAALAGLMLTWPAFQREVDTQCLDTDIVRQGWPKPTIYREHETIHILCNLIDNLRRELSEARNIQPDRDNERAETLAAADPGDIDDGDASRADGRDA